MKLVRYGLKGSERPGALDAQGRVRDLSTVLNDINGAALGPAQLNRLAGIDLATLPVVEGPHRFGAPLTQVGKFVAIGLNYRDHAEEANLPIPSEPILFMKATSCINGPDDDVTIPRASQKTDWEVELGIVIGSRCSYVEPEDALTKVAGYVLVNDVSEREYQIERGGTWDKGKSCDTFGPIGPWLVTAEDVGDPQALGLWLDVNGVRRQTGNTAKMIFDVKTIVSYVSQFMTLEPGDIITTGTPPGVGMGVKPEPEYLRPGDLVELGIDRLGVQRQRYVAYQPHRLRSVLQPFAWHVSLKKRLDIVLIA